MVRFNTRILKVEKFAIILLLVIPISCTKNKTTKNDENEWPVIKSYDQDHLEKIAFPIGGIGTGTISLGGRGDLKDWDVPNCSPDESPWRQDNNYAPCFSIYTRTENSQPLSNILRGSEPGMFQSAEKQQNNFYNNLPGFEKASFEAAYPFGQVQLSDSRMPVDVTIKGFNPFIPTEPDLSGLPVASLTYRIKNKTDKNLIVSVEGTMRNFISKKTEFRNYGYLKGIYMFSDSLPGNDTSSASVVLASLGRKKVTYRFDEEKDSFAGSIQEFWKDFNDDGELTQVEQKPQSNSIASIAQIDTLSPGESSEFKFLITWYFPDRNCSDEKYSGNSYSIIFTDAWNVAEQITPYLASFEKQTILFVRTLMNSGIPREALDAALSSLTKLRSPEIFRSLDGFLISREECCKNSISKPGPDKNIWSYDQSAPFLFGSLAQSIRERRSAMETTPVDSLIEVLNFYRDFSLSGDTALVKKCWDKIKSSVPGWKSNTGVRNEEYEITYSAVLKAAREMSLIMKDKEFSSRVDALYKSESVKAFNEIYRTDDLWGQSMAQICGLGYVAQKDKVARAFRNNRNSIDPEYTAAAGMIFENMNKEGIKAVSAIRSYYDGARGNPFDESIAGDSTRTMSAWALIVAATHFSYSAIDESMSIKLDNGSSFWSNGYAWGNITVVEQGKIKDVKIEVFGGKLNLMKFSLVNYGSRIISENKAVVIKQGQNYGFSIIKSAN